jgi:acyl transferase domain-containing protein
MQQAFHSSRMASVAEPYRASLLRATLHPPTVRMISTVTGTEVREEVAGVEYWLQHMLQPVRYLQAVQALFTAAESVALVEMGPDQTLTRLAQGALKAEECAASVVCLHGGVQETAGKRTYPLATRRHRLLQNTSQFQRDGPTLYECIFHPALMTVYRDHSIQGQLLFPATGYVEMALAAGARSMGGLAVELANVAFIEPCVLSTGTSLICQVNKSGSMEFRGTGSNDKAYCRLEYRLFRDARALDGSAKTGLQWFQEKCTEEIPGVQTRYKQLEDQGFHGPQFQTLLQVWQSSENDNGGQQLLARLRVPLASEGYYATHPALLDGMLQLGGYMRGNMTEAWVPAAIARVSLLSRAMVVSDRCLV